MDDSVWGWLAVVLVAFIIAGLGVRTHLQATDCHDRGGIAVREPLSINVSCVEQLDR